MVRITPVEAARKHHDWRPWVQHAQLHSAVRALAADLSGHADDVMAGRPAKLARHVARAVAIS